MRRLDRSDVDLNFVPLHAQGVGVERVADEVCHALAADAVETPLVVRAGDGLLFEDSVIQRHIPMRTASAISLELTTRWPDQEHALATGLKEAHAPFTHSTRVTDKGERHRGRLLKMNV
jgi:hypothetical protein